MWIDEQSDLPPELVRADKDYEQFVSEKLSRTDDSIQTDAEVAEIMKHYFSHDSGRTRKIHGYPVDVYIAEVNRATREKNWARLAELNDAEYTSDFATGCEEMLRLLNATS